MAPAFSVASDFSEGIASACTDEADLYIDDSGKTVSRFPRATANGGEDAIFGRWSFKEGLAGAHLRRPTGGHRIGFVDKTGEFKIAPQFRWARSFSEGFAAVRHEGGGWGFIDRTGQYVVDPTFERTRSFCDGRAAVELGDHWGYLNRKGVFVVKPGTAPRGGEGPINEAEDFRGGLARVHIGGEEVLVCDGPSEYEGGAWYYINREGEAVHRYCTDAQKRY